jgi:hypothetical protein
MATWHSFLTRLVAQFQSRLDILPTASSYFRGLGLGMPLLSPVLMITFRTT